MWSISVTVMPDTCKLVNVRCIATDESGDGGLISNFSMKYGFSVGIPISLYPKTKFISFIIRYTCPYKNKNKTKIKKMDTNIKK